MSVIQYKIEKKVRRNYRQEISEKEVRQFYKKYGQGRKSQRRRGQIKKRVWRKTILTTRLSDHE